MADVFDGDGGDGDHGLTIIGPAPGEPNDVIGDLVNVGLSANVGVPGANGGVVGANGGVASTKTFSEMTSVYKTKSI
ncbi:hypothetical protein A2U01_0095191 [Trifolium medium]|uniref:Uncharacterized protein n=1 Tax=Trifolium medium TaxID=97028 RepID=A0A392UME0_9FABA|nr:hypothetical protein [Trifolium medium]